MSARGAAPVDFRHCDCAPGTDLETCLEFTCSKEPRDIDVAPWMPITVGSNPLLPGPFGSFIYPNYAFPPKTTPSLGFAPARSFGDSMICADLAAHPDTTTSEACRVGFLETLFWNHHQDIADGRTTNLLFPEETYGIFWSHVELTAFASPRDFESVGSSGRLRDDYEIVHTPLTTAGVLSRIPTTPCPAGGCAPFLDTAFSIPPPPEQNPLRQLVGPVLIAPQTSGIVAGIRRGDLPAIDVTSAVSACVQSLLTDSGQMWIRPVEPPARAKEAGRSLAFVSIARDWKQSTSLPIQVVVVNGSLASPPFPQQLQIANEPPPPSTCAAAMHEPPSIASLPRYVPSDRSGARALLSTTEHSVYLVGGSRLGSPTGDIWRYDLNSHLWSALFTGVHVGSPPPAGWTPGIDALPSGPV